MPACRYMEENGSAAMLAAKRSAGVTPEVNLKVLVTCLRNPKGMSPEIRNRGISGPTKSTCAFQKLKQKIYLILICHDVPSLTCIVGVVVGVIFTDQGLLKCLLCSNPHLLCSVSITLKWITTLCQKCASSQQYQTNGQLHS